MKRSAIVLLPVSVLCAMFSRASGQDIQLGAKAGLAVVNFVGDKDTNFDSKLAFAGGFPLVYQISRNLAFAPEILYAQKGAETTATVEGVPLELNFSVIYLEFPLLARYVVSPRASISPVVSGGPVISWNIDSRVRYNAVGSDRQFNEPDDSIKSLDYGVAVGGGVDFSWDLRRLTVEMRYTRGISNIIDKNDDPKYNGVLSLTAGIGL